MVATKLSTILGLCLFNGLFPSPHLSLYLSVSILAKVWTPLCLSFFPLVSLSLYCLSTLSPQVLLYLHLCYRCADKTVSVAGVYTLAFHSSILGSLKTIFGAPTLGLAEGGLFRFVPISPLSSDSFRFALLVFRFVPISNLFSEQIDKPLSADPFFKSPTTALTAVTT